jgi:hypothetical protein
MDQELERLEAEFARHYDAALATGAEGSFRAALDVERRLARYRALSADRRVEVALRFAWVMQRTIMSALAPFPSAMLAVARAIAFATARERRR